ncbi:MAG: hypothetical protein HC895_17975 [Leptolyngbyaceae cyanobacterium SM1_3_5]|nr:hypothetical protein [Leptolyngbyaceae cyanobacterium SM1_3_5]
MTYQQRLKYWAIARFLPSEQWVIVARFYSRSDAEGHFQFLSRNLPSASFRIVFDVLDE